MIANEKLGWFSGSVFVAENNKIILDKSSGMANYLEHTPITPTTEFQIAGLPEQFTAMAILQLQQKGLIHVNDKLGQYLPQYPKWTDITIKELLTHTSGIPDYTEFVPVHTMENPQPIKSIINLVYSKRQNFAPGTQFHISNSNNVILGFLVQNLSGLSCADYFQKNIFAPLGMTQTGILLPPACTTWRQATRSRALMDTVPSLRHLLILILTGTKHSIPQ